MMKETRMQTKPNYGLTPFLFYASSVVSFSYSYNLANQRTLRREADQSLWRFDYDPLGQVKSREKGVTSQQLTFKLALSCPIHWLMSYGEAFKD